MVCISQRFVPYPVSFSKPPGTLQCKPRFYNHTRYDAYGRITSQSDPDHTTLFTFTARPFDPATNLQNNLNRWYDAETGRWISEDPIGFDAGDANLYRYVYNAPTLSVDPRGLQTPTPEIGENPDEAPSQGSPSDEGRILAWAANEEAKKELELTFKWKDEAAKKGY